MRSHQRRATAALAVVGLVAVAAAVLQQARSPEATLSTTVILMIPGFFALVAALLFGLGDLRRASRRPADTAADTLMGFDVVTASLLGITADTASELEDFGERQVTVGPLRISRRRPTDSAPTSATQVDRAMAEAIERVFASCTDLADRPTQERRIAVADHGDATPPDGLAIAS
ncbi:MAG: hypothetical protein QNJ12_03985 [Ilumatobacter sp.]|uniref:hypothetical protein n=1 Tax=Ilumatobacter sp. TaxID=1967498 RepID=UPI0026238B14|nr:hypothetical protein [Ilumatobacter sp.]MDJ0767923.1 hypothetical protein [Ilumatobacter sp.]